MVTKLIQALGKAAKVACLSFIAVVFLNGIVVAAAIAMPNDAANVAMSRAADKLDRVVGEGTSAQIEGKAKRDLGTVERGVGKVTGQVEGTAKQIEGKVKEDIGRTQSATEDVREDAEDATEGFIDSVKDLFD
ncbi:MAG: CsbD family protein [Cyanobacteria bacterium P01_D01_bin.56]